MSDAKAKYRRKLEERAKRLGISFSHVTTNSELLALVEKKEKTPTAPAVIEGKAQEVKSEIVKSQPSALAGPAQIIGGPPLQMAFNIAPPQLQYQFPQAPAWWEIAARVKDAMLFYVAGGATVYFVMTAFR